MKNNVLRVLGVNKSFGGVRANRDISIKVQEGSITALIGPNGSGKTTLFNSIVGYHPIDAGEIYFEDLEISQMRADAIARLGLLRTFQQTRIYGKMNCMQNMLISLPAQKTFGHLFASLDKSADEEAKSLLDFVGLTEKRHLNAGDLSFGQQKLLELAMALMNKPKMLLLDEPTGGINPTLINNIIRKLKEVNQNLGITMLVIEHNMRVVMDIADTIYCLANGKILAHGSPKEVRENPLVIDAYLGG